MTTQRQAPAAGIRLAPLITIACTTALLAGLLVIYLKHQVHVFSAQRVALEHEMRDLRAKADAHESQIVTLTSRAALQHRMNEGFLKLVPISTDRIVRARPIGAGATNSVALNSPRQPGLQPVTNERP